GAVRAGRVGVGRGGLGADVGDIDWHIFAEVRQRHRGGDAVIAGDNDAQRLHVAEAGRREQGADLLAFLGARIDRRGADYADDALNFVGIGAELAQDRADRLAALERYDALVPVGQPTELIGLWQQRHVLRGDARHEAEISAGFIGGVTQLDISGAGGLERGDRAG